MSAATMHRIQGLDGDFCENPSRRLILLVPPELELVDSYQREELEGMLLRTGPLRRRRRLSGDVKIENATFAEISPGLGPVQRLQLSIRETEAGADDEGQVEIGWLSDRWQWGQKAHWYCDVTLPSNIIDQIIEYRADGTFTGLELVARTSAWVESFAVHTPPVSQVCWHLPRRTDGTLDSASGPTETIHILTQVRAREVRHDGLAQSEPPGKDISINPAMASAGSAIVQSLRFIVFGLLALVVAILIRG